MPKPKVPVTAGGPGLEWLRVRRWLVINVALIILVMAGVGYVIYKQTMDKPPQPRPTGSSGIDLELAQREELARGKDYKPVYTDYLIMGNIYVSKGQLDLAEERLQRAEELAPEDVDVLYALTGLYRKMHNQKKALGYYDKLISIVKPSSHPRHDGLSLYLKERAAVSQGDLDLQRIKVDTGGMPL